MLAVITPFELFEYVLAVVGGIGVGLWLLLNIFDI